jgi:hypothetical protein
MLFDPNWKAKPKPATDADIYEAAADAIELRGHAKGRLQDEKGGVCLFGALSLVVNGEAFSGAGRAWTLLKAMEPFVDAYEAVKWNNAPERTQAEVVGALRAAAAAAKAY